MTHKLIVRCFYLDGKPLNETNHLFVDGELTDWGDPIEAQKMAGNFVTAMFRYDFIGFIEVSSIDGAWKARFRRSKLWQKNQERYSPAKWEYRP